MARSALLQKALKSYLQGSLKFDERALTYYWRSFYYLRESPLELSLSMVNSGAEVSTLRR
jgi:hypothetical protein